MVSEGKFIIASGPVIIEKGKLLVNKDNKDDFYKLPGGTIETGIEDLEQACHRETKEENKYVEKEKVQEFEEKIKPEKKQNEVKTNNYGRGK